MSLPDQNNPYGGPQGQQQQAQQQPAQQQQQPYGYPQYPGGGQPYPVYPGGAGPYGDGGGYPTSIPGKATAARIMMFISAGLQSLLSLLLLIGIAVAKDDFEDGFQEGSGVEVPAEAVAVVAGIYLVHAILGIVLASLFGRGAGGVRVGSIVWLSFLILFGVLALPLGIIWIALGIISIVMVANRDSGRWFARPRP
ncbi:hypothetical protein DMB38_22720 [Streptomyces sp. WAC 06738]|uniref:hypothetical protein n=1 Tax=Streptomyces sp. WAC 06738 TaxID=2203210 RepID=UPI000F7094A7|nr:hypothetical protein [Streptomyces sp. WAC 06738]AZM48224.1 hypothetical protein DMB38_22720 [Streptomyces sp. WAC 06738]